MRNTNKIRMIALALGLSATAMMQAGTSSAATSCEKQCQLDYEQCLVVCSENPCFVSCDVVYNACIENCGDES